MRNIIIGICASVAVSTIVLAQVAETPPPPTTQNTAALPEELAIIRTFDADLSKRFAFSRVIGQLLTSASLANTAAARQALVKTMLASYAKTSFTNPGSKLAMPVDKRPNEAGLSPAALLDPAHADGLIPVGIFSRPDLAPADWSDCGEQRIIYAIKSSSRKARFFIIFEAKLPNPQPKRKALGCQAVGKQWVAISQAGHGTARNALLDELFFKGLPGFKPVVQHAHYGGPLGQVRTDNFVGFTKWQLREFRVTAVAKKTIAFTPGPDALNPLLSFYQNNPIGSALEQKERTAFQTAFANIYQVQLRSIDATTAAGTDIALFKEALFNGLGAKIDPRSDEFQSDSQGRDDVPVDHAGSAIKAKIPANWASPVGNRVVTQEQMLHRAGAITCGGCHDFSVGSPIGTVNGQPLDWPQSLGFVHISEDADGQGTHDISDALKTFFIPFRAKAVLALANGVAPADAAPVFRLTAPSVVRTADTDASSARAVQDRTRVAELGNIVLHSGGDATRTADSLRAATEEARRRDTTKPGAFVEHRRAH